MLLSSFSRVRPRNGKVSSARLSTTDDPNDYYDYYLCKSIFDIFFDGWSSFFFFFHKNPVRVRLPLGSDGRFDWEAFVVVVVVVVSVQAVVVSSTRAVLLALQEQVVRARRVPLAAGRERVAVVLQEPLVEVVMLLLRPVRGQLHRVRDGLPAQRRRAAPSAARLAPHARDRGHHDDGEQHGRRAAQHAHVRQVRAAPVRAVGRVLVEAHRTVRHAVAPERRADARVQFRTPANTGGSTRTISTTRMTLRSIAV